MTHYSKPHLYTHRLHARTMARAEPEAHCCVSLGGRVGREFSVLLPCIDFWGLIGVPKTTYGG